jgi:hypothetical protein
MGRSKHTPEREHETFRGINRREECEGEREKEQARPRGEYLEDRRGRNLYTPMIPGSGCRSKYTPRREPETLSGYGREEFSKPKPFFSILMIRSLYNYMPYPCFVSPIGHNIR